MYRGLAFKRKFQWTRYNLQRKCLTIRLSIISFSLQHIFQDTIDCLSVPRCPAGNPLTTFRHYVLLTALSLSKASGTCPHLDVETLTGCVAGTFKT